MKNEYAEKNNSYKARKNYCHGAYVNFLGPPLGDLRQFIHGPRLQSDESNLRVMRSHIDDMELCIKNIQTELTSLLHLKYDLKLVSKVISNFLQKITSLQIIKQKVQFFWMSS